MGDRPLNRLFSEEVRQHIPSAKVVWIIIGVLLASAIALGCLINFNENYLSVIGTVSVSDSDMLTITKDVLSRNSWGWAFLCLLIISGLALVGVLLYPFGYAVLTILIQKNRRKMQQETISEETPLPGKNMLGEAESPSVVAYDAQRSDTRKQELPVVIPDDFDKYFLPKYIKVFHSNESDPRNNLKGVQQLEEQLLSKPWTATDLARIANLLYEADLVQPSYTSSGFRGWVKIFFDALSRKDAPNGANKNSYSEIPKALQKSFANLIYFYNATEKNYFTFE